jgi:hypothetical protein
MADSAFQIRVAVRHLPYQKICAAEVKWKRDREWSDICEWRLDFMSVDRFNAISFGDSSSLLNVDIVIALRD